MKTLDAAGTLKLETLDAALAHIQRLHAVVERMAVAVRGQQESSPFVTQARRIATPLVGLLKPQFGLIADQVGALLLAATRGGGDQARVRTLREGVAQLRTQVEIAQTRVIEKHAVAEPPRPGTEHRD
jgi:hypothetical protein